MKTSTEIKSTAKLVGYEEAVELIAKAGFDAFDFTLCDMCKFDHNTRQVIGGLEELNATNYVSFAKRIKQIGLDNGIICNQSHAPFPSSDPLIRSVLKRAIECTAIAGGKICIIHPDNNASAEKNAEMYFDLLDFAKEHDVKIATENMWGRNKERTKYARNACSSPEDFLAHLNAVNDDYLVACLDIGHAEMRDLETSAPEMIYALKDKLQALHIHDNNLKDDCHATPFTMDIDFSAMVKALKDINYTGYLTLECDNHYVNGGYTAETVEIGVKALFDSVQRIKMMF